MKRTLLVALLLALIATACGGDVGDETTTSTATTAPNTTAPTNGDDVLLVIRDEGGFAPIEFVINRAPTYTLLRNGTLIFEGPQPGAFPGPVMPGMRQVTLDAGQLEDIMVLIEASTLPEIDEVINNDAANFVADATTTVAVYFDEDGGEHTYSVYALGITIDQQLPDDLANLLLLRERLADFTGAGAGGEPYESDSLIIRVLESGGLADFDDSREWAFSFEPDDLPLLNNFPCLVVEGSNAAEVRSTLSDATQATTWDHESGTYAVLARDLLPGETGCDQQ